MLPFVLELSACHFQGLSADLAPTDLLRVEAVAPPRGFRLDFPQVGGDGRPGPAVFFETDELGMMLVALGLPREHGLSEQALAPERDQSFGIQVLRMQRPESHLLVGTLRRDSSHSTKGFHCFQSSCARYGGSSWMPRPRE